MASSPGAVSPSQRWGHGRHGRRAVCATRSRAVPTTGEGPRGTCPRLRGGDMARAAVARLCGGGSGLAPAAEDEAAEGEAEPEGADAEAADRDGLPPRRQPLPPAERLRLL